MVLESLLSSSTMKWVFGAVGGVEEVQVVVFGFFVPHDALQIIGPAIFGGEMVGGDQPVGIGGLCGCRRRDNRNGREDGRYHHGSFVHSTDSTVGGSGVVTLAAWFVTSYAR